MVRFLVLALLWPLQAMADVTEDALRAMVGTGDIAGVEGALRAAVVADQGRDIEPDAARNILGLFTDTQPEIDAFTLRWLEAEPGDALALVARGWHLHALGWNARGTGWSSNLHPDAARAMRDYHQQAWDLAEAAVAAEPGLVAASDLKLVLTKTLGNPETVPAELDRIMTLHPNRGSLMRAMEGLAPQWGGNPTQVMLLCDRYAPMIRSVPDYDRQVCAIDAVYWANFPYGEERDTAQQALQLTPNPVLDYARRLDALNGFGPPQQRIRLFEGLKASRDLTRPEAMALDSARAELAGGLNTLDDWKIAVGNAVIWNRTAADEDPYDPDIVNGYVGSVFDAENNLGQVADVPDLIARLERLLARVPWSSEAWIFLGDLTSRTDTPGTVDLDRIARAEPYYINGVVYANYSHAALKSLVWTKFWAIIDVKGLQNDVDVSGLTPSERARYDAVIYCPMIRQVTILGIVCRNQGIPEDQCGGFHVQPERIFNRLRFVMAEGSCPDEVNRDPATLAYSPIAIDFAAAP